MGGGVVLIYDAERVQAHFQLDAAVGKAFALGKAARDLEEDDNAPAPAPVKLNRVEVDDGYAVDVPKDMTVEQFASLADVPVAKLRELNPDLPAKQLKKGSTFIIPKN